MRTVSGLMTLCAAVVLSAIAGAADDERPVEDLTFEELISIVFFENERAYLDTRSFFCNYIALSGPGDYCNASLRVIDPKTCKTEVIRELQVTYGQGAGREFMRAREVFTLASLDLKGRITPEFDEKSGAFRQRFLAPIDIYVHEGFQYSFVLDEKGGYKACRIDGKEMQVSEDDCVKAGTKASSTSKTMTLGFNKDKYQRSMAAISKLQETYCPAGGEPL